MSILNKVVNAATQRGLVQAALRYAGWAAAGWAAIALPTALPVGYGVLAIAVIAVIAIIVFARYNRAEIAGPAAGKVQMITLSMFGGIGYAVWTAVRALGSGIEPMSRLILIGLLVVSIVLIVWVAWSRLRNTNPTSWPVTIGDAIDAFTDGGRLRAALLAAVVTAPGVSLAYAGVTLAPVAIAIAALIPVLLGLKAARVRGRTRVEFSAAFVGLIPVSGSGAWTRAMEDANRSPITCAWDDDRDAPTRIAMPLPPGWRATGEASLETEVAARLVEHGNYVIRVDLGSKRRVTATLVPPMPTSVRYDGRPADGTRVWLGVGRATHTHADNGRPAGIGVGDLFDFTWDLRTEPMGIAVGQVGSGKSQTVQLAMIQLALAGFRLILIDPKKVEFGQWRGRPGVLAVTTELADHAQILRDAVAEMNRRYDEMEAAGVNHLDLLPVTEDSPRPPRLLVVIDEIVELLSQAPGKSDDAKETNDLKSQCEDAIGSILRMGRAAGIHALVAGQRADRKLVSGEWQNNLAFKIIQGSSEQIERTMIGLSDVIATPGIPGRAVGRTLLLPQTELQVAYVDLQKDLDRYLPKGGALPEAPEVDLRPEDLIPPVPVKVVHAPASKPIPVATNTNDDGDADGPKFHFDVQQPMAPGEAQIALDAMIGLDGVKTKIREIVAQVEVEAKRQSLGATGSTIVTCPNIVAAGAPGTGKTVSMRIIASRLAEIGVGAGVLLECDRADLVSTYLGWTAKNVDGAFNAVADAGGGILFVDEAYSLLGDQFGKEAIETILKRAEDMPTVTVAFAGYPNEIDRLLDSNPGLRSRFPERGRITFESYTDPELIEIYESMMKGLDRDLEQLSSPAVAAMIAAAPRGKDWANGRTVRNMVDVACANADVRLHQAGLDYVTLQDLRLVTEADVSASPPVQADVQDGPQEVLEGTIVDDVGDAAVDADVDWIGDFLDDLTAKDAHTPA